MMFFLHFCPFIGLPSLLIVCDSRSNKFMEYAL